MLNDPKNWRTRHFTARQYILCKLVYGFVVGMNRQYMLGGVFHSSLEESTNQM